jgi:hypothetical protein
MGLQGLGHESTLKYVGLEGWRRKRTTKHVGLEGLGRKSTMAVYMSKSGNRARDHLMHDTCSFPGSWIHHVFGVICWTSFWTRFRGTFEPILESLFGTKWA